MSSPGQARILGDCRSFRPDVSAAIEREMRSIAASVAAAHGCKAEVAYTREFVPLINDRDATDAALKAARASLGAASVRDDAALVTASEDFARLLQHVPGCFVLLGNGESRPLHNPGYDFNDEALPYGVKFLVELARQRLPETASPGPPCPWLAPSETPARRSRGAFASAGGRRLPRAEAASSRSRLSGAG